MLPSEINVDELLEVLQESTFRKAETSWVCFKFPALYFINCYHYTTTAWFIQTQENMKNWSILVRLTERFGRFRDFFTY